MSNPTRGFVHESTRYLRDVYVPRLRRALATLPAEDLWWRPHEDAISFGTILLHLEGNVRQWIVAGLGDSTDARNRASEFAARGGPAGAELMERLAQTVAAACGVIEKLDEPGLAATHVIQGDEIDAQSAIYHVVEHFSWHCGQATWIAKARGGANHGLAFFDDALVNAAKNE
jgi:uncharacterized damage-inducible protein DinB